MPRVVYDPLTLHTLLIGNRSRAEFTSAAALLAGHSHCHAYSTPSQALAEMPREFPKKSSVWIVCLHSRAGELDPAEVLQPRAAFPQARLISLLGSCCEGETRTAAPLAEADRVPWYRWPAWLAAQFANGDVAPAPLAEIAIHAWQRDDFEALCEALAGLALDFRWLDPRQPISPPSGPGLLFIDGPRQGRSNKLEAQPLIELWRPRPIVVSLDFPRVEDVTLLKASGVSAVVPRPCPVSELRWFVEQAVAQALA